MSENSFAYFRIFFSQFRVGDKLPCDIYTNTETGKSRLLGKGTFLSEPLFASLLDAQELLFIKTEDLVKYHSFVQTSLSDFLEDQTIDMATKSKKVYEVASQTLKALFEQPTGENMEQAKEVVHKTTDLIFKSEEARKTLFSLAGHDYYTYTHSCNVGIFGTGLAKALMGGMETNRARKLGLAFFFHDIGKIEIDPEIIQKPGPLTHLEWAEMKKHPRLGLKLLKKFNLLTSEARDVVLQHHEKLDGTGYPEKLSGPEIHPFARMCTVVDVFDALTSERSYRHRSSPFEACKIMRNETYKCFDPKILDVFIHLLAASPN